MTDHTPPTDQQLTPAEIRLAQYGQRTSTWSTATYNDGTEKALHEIALELKTELDRVRGQRRFLLDQIAKKDARSGEGDRALREFLSGEEQPDEVDRLRAELADQRDRYTTGLRRADEHVNAMSEELKRYADGKEHPVLWSVYNAMHGRAATAEGRVAELERQAAGRRVLTESEHDRAWHAIEGAAGEEGADPGTVLNAVLRALRIDPPAEESRVVADDSSDPEHTDDCPGCETAARPAAPSA